MSNCIATSKVAMVLRNGPASDCCLGLSRIPSQLLFCLVFLCTTEGEEEEDEDGEEEDFDEEEDDDEDDDEVEGEEDDEDVSGEDEVNICLEPCVWYTLSPGSVLSILLVGSAVP